MVSAEIEGLQTSGVAQDPVEGSLLDERCSGPRSRQMRLGSMKTFRSRPEDESSSDEDCSRARDKRVRLGPMTTAIPENTPLTFGSLLSSSKKNIMLHLIASALVLVIVSGRSNCERTTPRTDIGFLDLESQLTTPQEVAPMDERKKARVDGAIDAW